MCSPRLGNSIPPQEALPEILDKESDGYKRGKGGTIPPDYSHQSPVDTCVTNAGSMRTYPPSPLPTHHYIDSEYFPMNVNLILSHWVAQKENVRPLYDFCLGHLPSVAAEAMVGRQHTDVLTVEGGK